MIKIKILLSVLAFSLSGSAAFGETAGNFSNCNSLIMFFQSFALKLTPNGTVQAPAPAAVSNSGYSVTESRFLRQVFAGSNGPKRILDLPSTESSDFVALTQFLDMGGVKNYKINVFDTDSTLINKAFWGRISQSDGEMFIIPRSIRKKLRFRIIDFETASPEKVGQYDLIVSGSFLGYFDKTAMTAMVAKMADSLNKGGYLMVNEEFYVLKMRPEIFRNAGLVKVPGYSVFQKN